jgi:hypothetical protein
MTYRRRPETTSLKLSSSVRISTLDGDAINEGLIRVDALKQPHPKALLKDLLKGIRVISKKT